MNKADFERTCVVNFGFCRTGWLQASKSLFGELFVQILYVAH